MKDLRDLDRWRVQPPAFWQGRGKMGDREAGAFLIRRSGIYLRIIASSGDGWDHVSVSTTKRCPTWEEMNFIADIFFPDEAVMQLHVPAGDHINYHPHCLHWWRPHDGEIQRPPSIMVGPKKEEQTA